MDGETNQFGDESNLSVVDRVLVQFTKAVGNEEGYADIANRLQKTLLGKRDTSEGALERALFEVEQS